MLDDKKIIEYMPNKVYKYFNILLLVIAIIEAILFVMCIFSRNRETASMFFLFLCIVVLFMVILNYLSKLKIIFTQDAIYIKQNERQEPRVFFYEEYSYVYYFRDYKARLHMILSSKKQDNKTLKRIVGKASQTVTENCVVIFLDNSKSRKRIKQLISKKIPNVFDEI